MTTPHASPHVSAKPARHFGRCVRTALGAAAVLPAALLAQQPGTADPAAPACALLCAPAFLAQPGVVVANALNAPALDATGQSAGRTPELLLRVTTAVPTRLERLTLVGIVQFTPFARETQTSPAGQPVTVTHNAPTFVYGSVVDVASVGPLGLTFNVLGAYGRHGTPNAAGDVQDYRHQLVLEVDANLAVGRLLGAAFASGRGTAPGDGRPGRLAAALQGVSAYAFLAQPMTGRPQDYRGRRVYSPTLLTGLTVPLARPAATGR